MDEEAYNLYSFELIDKCDEELNVLSTSYQLI